MNEPAIGVIATEHFAAGLVSGKELLGSIHMFPPADAPVETGEAEQIHTMPMEAMAESIAQLVQGLCKEHNASPRNLGIGFPGIICNGTIDESPNLKQAKGAHLSDQVGAALSSMGITMKVSLFNDADVTAAGIAATRGQLEQLIRVWTLGHGIGFGRYPHLDGVWEGGHVVVSLDPKESLCGCGGKGHLEGIMGHRAMRLRFLDLEPDEVFENAKAKDPRCMDFERLWHRALAAGSATSIHMQGPGKFFICGSSAKYVQTSLLSQYLHEMVTMTPLQGSVFEVVPMNDEIAVIGAAVNASRADANSKAAG